MEVVSRNIKIVLNLQLSIDCKSCSKSFQTEVSGLNKTSNHTCPYCSTENKPSEIIESINKQINNLSDIHSTKHKNRSINMKNDTHSAMVWGTGIISVTGDTELNEAVKFIEHAFNELRIKFDIVTSEITNVVIKGNVGCAIELYSLYNRIRENSEFKDIKGFDDAQREKYSINLSHNKVGLEVYNSGSIILRHSKENVARESFEYFKDFIEREMNYSIESPPNMDVEEMYVFKSTAETNLSKNEINKLKNDVRQ